MKKITLLTSLALFSNIMFAGCSESNDGLVSVRHSPAPTRMSRTPGSPAPERGAASDSDVLFGYVTPTDPRFNITLSEVQEHASNNTAVFIDARGPVAYALGHVRGALNMPAGMMESYLPKIRESVAPDQFIIIYCNSPYCDSSEMVYEFLVSQGYSNMRIFKPGWQELSSVSSLR